jgi:predicted amidohydrolase YtcJ
MMAFAGFRSAGGLFFCALLWTLTHTCLSSSVGNTDGQDSLGARDAGPYRDGTLGGDVVLFNGKIYTMDANNQLASVVAIRDGRVVYIGGNKRDALQGFDVKPRAINLGGRMVIPGLIDSHNHIVLMGNRPGYHTPLENAYSVAQVQETYKSRARGVPKGGFITTIGGFHPNQFLEKRLPTLAELDAALPDHPAFVSYSFSGPSSTNTLGKAFFESQGQPVNVGLDGSIAAGIENGKALLSLRRQLTFEDRKRSVRDAMAYALSMGVTTHLDQGGFPASGTPSDGAANEDLYAMHLPWLSVYDDRKGTVRLRINFLHLDATIDLPTLQQRLLNTFKFFGNDMVRTGGIGEFIAANSTSGPIFEEAARRIAQAGWRLEVHSLSSTDFQTQIQGFEKIHAERSIANLRWVVAHVPLITKEYLARLKALGGGVNLSGWQYLAGRGPNAGPPFKDIVESGIHAGLGADGMQIAPMNPWIHAYYATTGKNALGEQINAGQQISRLELLQMYTRANQWFLGGPDEHLLGAIEAGRLGDVVVLNDDYFAVSDEGLKRLRSVLTIVGGVVVHDTGECGD